jgi:hypothetical protein
MASDPPNLAQVEECAIMSRQTRFQLPHTSLHSSAITAPSRRPAPPSGLLRRRYAMRLRKRRQLGTVVEGEKQGRVHRRGRRARAATATPSPFEAATRPAAVTLTSPMQRCHGSDGGRGRVARFTPPKLEVGPSPCRCPSSSTAIPLHRNRGRGRERG